MLLGYSIGAGSKACLLRTVIEDNRARGRDSFTGPLCLASALLPFTSRLVLLLYKIPRSLRDLAQPFFQPPFNAPTATS